MASFTEAYRQAGYKLNNPRNQWSARKADGSGVAITVWADEIEKGDEPWVFDCIDHPEFDEWGGRVGNSIRRRDIAYGLENLGGEFDIILCTAVDPKAQPRKIKFAKFWRGRRGYIAEEDFDEATGQFRMELRPVITAADA